MTRTVSTPDTPTSEVPDRKARVTAEVVNRARALAFADLPESVVSRAQHCVLDWLGVAIAGADAPATAIVRAEAIEEGGTGVATLVGTGQRVTRSQAALVNGTASHALDYDDVSSAMGGHPSVPVLPALLALAEETDLSGAAFLTTFVAGFETECRIGRLMAPEHYARGFHATGTVGTFGASAACAHAAGLTEDQWRNALGIAGTQAAGLKSMFGTMCKPFHAGRAAQNGLAGAVLAARGFTAHPDVLDVAQGFASTQTTSANPERALALGPDEFDLRDVLFKFHAACFFTHSSIEGLLQLREKHGFTADDVVGVELRVPPGHLAACNIPEPTTPLEGKFSLRFTSALALVRGDVSERAFTPEALVESDLLRLRDRVTVIAEYGGDNAHVTTVIVELADGDRVRASVDMSRPTPDEELDCEWQRLTTKFISLVAPVLGRERALELIALVATLPDQPTVRPLATLSAPPHGESEEVRTR